MTTITAGQAASLREPFPDDLVGKLPRITCKECSDARARVCTKHAKVECQECRGYLTERHIHIPYVGHAAVTDRLLQVDPGWTWEPVATDPNTGAPVVTNSGLWIRLTVCGVTRIGFGDETNGKGVKEMIGDAIRNAAMRFGVALDHWSKADLLRSQFDEPEPAPKERTSRGATRPAAPPAEAAQSVAEQPAEASADEGSAVAAEIRDRAVAAWEFGDKESIRAQVPEAVNKRVMQALVLSPITGQPVQLGQLLADLLVKKPHGRAERDKAAQ